MNTDEITSLTDDELKAEWQVRQVGKYVWHVIGILNAIGVLYSLSVISLLCLCYALWWMNTTKKEQDIIIAEAVRRRLQ